MDGVTVQAFGGVQLEHAVRPKDIDGAHLRHHVGGDQYDNLVEPFLRIDWLRHDFAEPSE